MINGVYVLRNRGPESNDYRIFVYAKIEDATMARDQFNKDDKREGGSGEDWRLEFHPIAGARELENDLGWDFGFDKLGGGLDE